MTKPKTETKPKGKQKAKAPARRTTAGDPTDLGRPLTLDAALSTELASLLRRGLTQTDACLVAGVPRSTFYDWLSRGKDLWETHGPDGLVPPETVAKLTVEELVLLDFSDAIAGARAVGKHDALVAIRSGMTDDWRAAAWFLERSFPDEFGRRDRIEVETDETVTIRIKWPEELHDIIDVEEVSPNGPRSLNGPPED